MSPEDTAGSCEVKRPIYHSVEPVAGGTILGRPGIQKSHQVKARPNNLQVETSRYTQQRDHLENRVLGVRRGFAPRHQGNPKMWRSKALATKENGNKGQTVRPDVGALRRSERIKNRKYTGEEPRSVTEMNITSDSSIQHPEQVRLQDSGDAGQKFNRRCGRSPVVANTLTAVSWEMPPQDSRGVKRQLPSENDDCHSKRAKLGLGTWHRKTSSEERSFHLQSRPGGEGEHGPRLCSGDAGIDAATELPTTGSGHPTSDSVTMDFDHADDEQIPHCMASAEEVHVRTRKRRRPVYDNLPRKKANTIGGHLTFNSVSMYVDPAHDEHIPHCTPSAEEVQVPTDKIVEQPLKPSPGVTIGSQTSSTRHSFDVHSKPTGELDQGPHPCGGDAGIDAATELRTTGSGHPTSNSVSMYVDPATDEQIPHCTASAEEVQAPTDTIVELPRKPSPGVTIGSQTWSTRSSFGIQSTPGAKRVQGPHPCGGDSGRSAATELPTTGCGPPTSESVTMDVDLASGEQITRCTSAAQEVQLPTEEIVEPVLKPSLVVDNGCKTTPRRSSLNPQPKLSFKSNCATSSDNNADDSPTGTTRTNAYTRRGGSRPCGSVGGDGMNLSPSRRTGIPSSCHDEDDQKYTDTCQNSATGSKEEDPSNRGRGISGGRSEVPSENDQGRWLKAVQIQMISLQGSQRQLDQEIIRLKQEMDLLCGRTTTIELRLEQSSVLQCNDIIPAIHGVREKLCRFEQTWTEASKTFITRLENEEAKTEKCCGIIEQQRTLLEAVKEEHSRMAKQFESQNTIPCRAPVKSSDMKKEFEFLYSVTQWAVDILNNWNTSDVPPDGKSDTDDDENFSEIENDSTVPMDWTTTPQEHISHPPYFQDVAEDGGPYSPQCDPPDVSENTNHETNTGNQQKPAEITSPTLSLHISPTLNEDHEHPAGGAESDISTLEDGLPTDNPQSGTGGRTDANESVWTIPPVNHPEATFKRRQPAPQHRDILHAINGLSKKLHQIGLQCAKMAEAPITRADHGEANRKQNCMNGEHSRMGKELESQNTIPKRASGKQSDMQRKFETSSGVDNHSTEEMNSSSSQRDPGGRQPYCEDVDEDDSTYGHRCDQSGDRTAIDSKNASPMGRPVEYISNRPTLREIPDISRYPRRNHSTSTTLPLEINIPSSTDDQDPGGGGSPGTDGLSTEEIQLGPVEQTDPKEPVRATARRRGPVDRSKSFVNRSPPPVAPAAPAFSRSSSISQSVARRGRRSQGKKRHPWSEEETNALLNGLIYFKEARWADILKRFGEGGCVSEALKNRSQTQLKDKARNIKLSYQKQNIQVPDYLEHVTGKLRRDKNL